jgi:hypothetical protein
MGPILRRAFVLFLPTAAATTVLAGLVYVAVQQNFRQNANDPQVQIAEDAAARLSAGASPQVVASGDPVDLARSLAPYTIVYDAEGGVLASTGSLGGHAPVPPEGVLASATGSGIDTLTWQPQDGVRQAIVVVPWHASSESGTVLAGRSLREIESREDQLTLMVGAAWLAALGAGAVASVLGAYLWLPGFPRSPRSA